MKKLTATELFYASLVQMYLRDCRWCTKLYLECLFDPLSSDAFKKLYRLCWFDLKDV
jgi:hypothetical protein